MTKTPLTKEYLEQKIKNENLTYDQISEISGWSICYISKTVNKLGLRQKKNFKNLNLIGQKFGRLTVLGKAERLNHCNRWRCVCSCGEFRSVSTGNLISGGTKSCGCGNHKKGKESKCWKGEGELTGTYITLLKRTAEKRKIKFLVSIEYLWSLFLKQNKKCNLTGWEISLSRNGQKQTASLDRIDNSKDYIEGNVQWLHKDVNKAKNTHDQEYFLKMCQAVAKNSLTGENEELK